ncbi:unnamed protein product [Chrysoparadoxa australica]
MGAVDVDALRQRGVDRQAPIAKVPDSSISEQVWSSGVVFYPPSKTYWRIGGEWYDFREFLNTHPGGAQVLQLARDRFEDCTFVFEAHHHNYQRARAMIRKYKVSRDVVRETWQKRPEKDDIGAEKAHFDSNLEQLEYPSLLGKTSFYSILRRRVTDYLMKVGHPDGGPTLECKILFWTIFVAWAVLWWGTWASGSLGVSVLWGLISAWLGAFGHNWVHQPYYKKWGWALLSLDTVGFSSEAWYREHVLQHHMYTNTPWDNHFRGTDPFLKTDPTVPRSFLQGWVMPYINPLVLCFGVYGNYIVHTAQLLQGNEVWSIGKLILPLQFASMITRWGWLYGVALMFACHGFIGVYYFTLALMNHNAEHCHDVSSRNKSVDFGHAQLNSSADWAVNLGFLPAMVYLWLNYHTVHHLFPRIDMSHHRGIQRILMETCREHDIKYSTSDFMTIYCEMVNSFATPHSLFKEIFVHAGGI